MALVIKDRVQETSTTTGTGSLTLLGAVTGYQTFSTAIGNTNTTYYVISDGTNWEVGVGTVGAGTLSRDTLLSSSTGAFVSFPAGTKNVWCDLPSAKAITVDNMPSKLVVTVRAGTTINVPIASGVISVLNRSGSTISVPVS